MKIYITVIFNIFIFFSHFSMAQVTADSAEMKKRILVVGFDTTQFYTNVFYIDELAYYNNTTTYKVVDLYKKKLLQVLKYHDNKNEYEFIIADSADQYKVFKNSDYLEVENDYGEPFIGIAAKIEDTLSNIQGQLLVDLMKKYNTSYLLTINAYEIYKKNPPEYTSYATRTQHIIHYDLFNRELNSLFSGKISLKAFANEAYYMVSNYQEFAEEILLRLEAFLQKDEFTSMQEKYLELKEAYIKNRTGLGVTAGFGAPYGLFGVLMSRYLSKNLELNAGLGYDFNGFKIGAGARLYMMKFNSQLKPFLGLNYAYASGNTFEIGGATDEFGTQLEPDDVSRIRIFKDHAIMYLLE